MNFLYLLIMVIYVLGCCLFGLLLIHPIVKRNNLYFSIDWYAIIASAFLLGQAIIANVWLLMGVAGIFSPVVITITFMGIAGVSLFFLRHERTGLLAPVVSTIGRFRGLSWYWQGLGLLMVILFFLNFGIKAIVSPPLGDAEAFYMVLPKIMAASHRLVPQPNYYSFTQIGLSAEMHFAALMSLASPHAAKLFVWVTAIALSGMLIAINTEIGNSRIGKIVTVVLLFSSTTVTSYIYDGKVDIFGCAFGLAAYYWALQTDRIPGKAPYLLTGLFTGFAVIAKISNIPVLVPGIVILIVWNNFTRKVSLKERYMSTTKWLCIFGLITVCAIIPHLIKNYVLFGEPFAPFLFLKSAGEYWTEQSWFSKETTRYIIMTYPIALLYGQYDMQGGNISFLLLAFLPLIFVLPKNTYYAAKPFRQVTVIALVGLVLWIFLRPSVLAPRYILATLLLFIPLVACGVERLFSEQAVHLKLLRWAVFLSMLIVVGSMLPIRGTYFNFKQLTQHFFSRQSDYSPGKSFEVINSLAQPGERVFFVGYYGYFLSPEVLQCINGPNDNNLFPTKQENARFNWADLFDRGFKYLLLSKRTHSEMANALQTDTAPLWLSVKKIFDDEFASIYSISSLDPGKKPSITCKQIHPPAWDVVKTNYFKIEKP